MDWRPPLRSLLVEFKAASDRFGGQPDSRSGYPDEWDHPQREAVFFHEIIKIPEGEHRQPSDMRWVTQFPEPWQKQIAWSHESDEQEHVFACGRPDAFTAFQTLSERAAECLPQAVVVPEPLHCFKVPPTHLERYLIDRWSRFVYQQLGRHTGFLVRRHNGWMELSRNFFAASALAIEMSILPFAHAAEVQRTTNASIPPSERRKLPFWTGALRKLARRDYFADRERRFALSNVGDLIRCAVQAGALDRAELDPVVCADWRQLHDADAAARLLQLLNVPTSVPFNAPDVTRRLADALDALNSQPGGSAPSRGRGLGAAMSRGPESDVSDDDQPHRDEAAATAAYLKALQVLYETGRRMEDLPSTYHAKDEEAIRDHLLSVLASHFQSATGETFNKKGRTDVLLTHNGSPVLLAECKFWDGEKQLLKTVDQMLGYCTWRNKRAAVLLFVQTKVMTPVVQRVEALPRTHPSCVTAVGMSVQGWYDFDFHLPDDPESIIRVAVQCFHFPPTKSTNTNDASSRH